LAEQFRGEEISFLSITVDPETDTPERLAEYAQGFQADANRWRFLTGPMSEIQLFAQRSFRIALERVTHTEKLFLIDRWGKVRDQFSWDDPEEIRRLAEVARQLIAETEPPLDATIATRNLMAGRPHNEEFTPVILDEFFLTQANGSLLFSRDLLGEVWIGSVFFSSCPTHCVAQNRYLRDLQDRLGPRPVRIVSISTDPVIDTPQRLQQYAKDMEAQTNRWLFLTGQSKSYVDRVAAEFLGLFVQGSDHATELVVVDRWGHPRGKFDWRDPGQEAEMFRKIDELLVETHPPPWDQRLKSTSLE
jgi:protein SCO1/2